MKPVALPCNRNRGRVPHISLVFREMWDSTALFLWLLIRPMHLALHVSGVPHPAKNERDTRISCTRHLATTACAAFIKESRMKFINANKRHRKSGVWGTRPWLCN
jgi:hypothetical protein